MTGSAGVRIAACAADVLENCRKAGLTLATVESCTGGLIAAALTAIAGSSDVLDRGFVTYSNDAKTELVGVPAELIQSHGAVSKEVACAMAEGGLLASGADIAVAVTGIAGPGGGSAEKPVGLVHVACARSGAHDTRHQHYVFPGDRDAVREASVVGQPHPDWGEVVVAFVVPQPGAATDEKTLDALCLDNIARFKRPKDYRFVETLPKNNYGKVLKTELRALLAAEDEKTDG